MSATLLVLYNTPTDPDAFEDYYLGTHLPLVKAVPGLRTAARSREVGSPAGPPGVHQVSTYTWDTMAELEEGLRSPAGEAAANDLPNVATGGATVLFFENEDL